MTNKEYIMACLSPFGVREEMFANVYDLIDPNAKYMAGVKSVSMAMIRILEDVLFMPRVESINENGFSMTYNFKEAAKFYVMLCKRYGMKPNDHVLSMAGISRIVDRTSKW